MNIIIQKTTSYSSFWDEEAPDGFPNAQAADGAQHGPAYAYSYRQDGAQRENGGRSASNRTLWVILLILTCPIWICLLYTSRCV